MSQQKNPQAAGNAGNGAYDPSASSLAGSVQDEVMAELLSIRSSIDNFDATLVYLLAERFKATQRVGPPQGRARPAAERSRDGKRRRSSACAVWPRKRTWTRNSPKNS